MYYGMSIKQRIQTSLDKEKRQTHHRVVLGPADRTDYAGDAFHFLGAVRAVVCERMRRPVRFLEFFLKLGCFWRLNVFTHTRHFAGPC